MKRRILFLLTIGLLLSSVSRAESGEKFAIVNLQQALLQVNAGKTARDKLKKDYEAKKVEIDREKETWQADADALKKQASVLSQEAVQEKAQAIQKRLMDIQTKAANYERELAQADADSTKQIISGLQDCVKEIATQKGFAMVFENSAQVVLFAPTATDITQDVVTMFNKKGSKK